MFDNDINDNFPPDLPGPDLPGDDLASDIVLFLEPDDQAEQPARQASHRQYSAKDAAGDVSAAAALARIDSLLQQDANLIREQRRRAKPATNVETRFIFALLDLGTCLRAGAKPMHQPSSEVRSAVHALWSTFNRFATMLGMADEGERIARYCRLLLRAELADLLRQHCITPTWLATAAHGDAADDVIQFDANARKRAEEQAAQLLQLDRAIRSGTHQQHHPRPSLIARRAILELWNAWQLVLREHTQGSEADLAFLDLFLRMDAKATLHNNVITTAWLADNTLSDDDLKRLRK